VHLYIIILMAVVFGLLASVMAYLITYNEYERHGFPKNRLIKESLKTAFVAFAFLFVLASIAGYIFLKFNG
jgi:O-antigen/teichoic acid export membrane protein